MKGRCPQAYFTEVQARQQLAKTGQKLLELSIPTDGTATARLRLFFSHV
jgi:hypothetical protein